MKTTLCILFITMFLMLNVAISAATTSQLTIQELIIPDVGITEDTPIVLTEVPDGLSGYNITVSIADTSLASITNITFPSWAILQGNSTLPASQCWLKAVDLNDVIQPGASNVTLATISFTSILVGSTTLNLSITELDNDSGFPISCDIQNSTLIVNLNTPPNAPTSPSPANNSQNIGVSPTLSVYGSDPDNQTITITFFNADDNSVIDTPQVLISNGTASVSWIGLKHRTTYRWYATANDTSFVAISDTWAFTTKKKSSSGGGGPPAPPSPVADLSAGAPYTGFVDEAILFNASKSSDNSGIVNYSWDFGDATYGYGELVYHVYTEPGEYTIVLTVHNEFGMSDTDQTMVTIVQPNRSPSKPLISGPTFGSQYINYEFTFYAADHDNDSIKYVIDWGDQTTSETAWQPNGSVSTSTHAWNEAGIYTIVTRAWDTSNASSEETRYTMFVDAIYCEDIGYLLDSNSDDTYDQFLSNLTGNISLVTVQDYGYLIDADQDGKWDYVFDEETGLTIYTIAEETPGFELLLLVIAYACIIIVRRRNQ